MPILDVTIVGALEPEYHTNLARRLADASAVALGSRPAGTWVRLHHLPADQYAENAPPAYVPPPPVFVEVLSADQPMGALLAAEVEGLTNAVAVACGRSVGQVHILYQPSARGRLALGGKLLE